MRIYEIIFQSQDVLKQSSRSSDLQRCPKSMNNFGGHCRSNVLALMVSGTLMGKRSCFHRMFCIGTVYYRDQLSSGDIFFLFAYKNP